MAKTTMQTAWYQQGDVIIRAAEIPAKASKPAGRVLAFGEATGHAHRLTDASDGLLDEVDGQLYLSVGKKGADVVHEEHGAITIPPGTYRVDRVKEYDHFQEEARVVRD